MGRWKLRPANLTVTALCLGLAGAAQADEKSALIFVDLPESLAMLTEGNRLFFVRSDAEEPARRVFDLEMAEHHAIREGVERYVFSVVSDQQGQLDKWDAKTNKTPDCVDAACLAYVPGIKLCRQGEQQARFVTIRWGLMDATGTPIAKATAATMVKISKSMDECGDVAVVS